MSTVIPFDLDLWQRLAGPGTVLFTFFIFDTSMFIWLDGIEIWDGPDGADKHVFFIWP
jgi:hypothetical protein